MTIPPEPPPFPLEIVRSKRRKTASIRLVEGGGVRVTIPRHLPDRWVHDLLRRRSQWIRRQLALQSEVVPLKPKAYVEGARLTYLGRNYCLKRVHGAAVEARLRQGCLCISTPDGLTGAPLAVAIRGALERWYAARALAKLSEKTQRYAALLGVAAKSIAVRDYKSRWGSCSVSGDIRYNWRIIMSPQPIVDYVVVHELCHLLEHNHSARYWRHVEGVIADYRERRQWLKIHGNSLLF